MSSAKLIADSSTTYRKKFKVEIDISNLNDEAIEALILEQYGKSLDFVDDIYDIIRGKKNE